MAITFECPKCGEQLRAANRDAGRKVRCEECGERLTVPEPLDEPAAAPPRRRSARGERVTNPLVWVGAALAVVAVVGAVVAAVVFAVRSGRTDWQPYAFDRGGFSAEFPAPPRDDMNDQLFVPAPMNVEGTMVRRRAFAVLWQDMPPNPMTNDQALIDETVRGMRNGFAAGEVRPGQWKKVDGFTARDAEMVGPDGTVTVRVVIAEGRLFVAMAGGPGVTANDPQVARFLDSFKITDPVLLAAAKRREEAAEQARKVEEIQEKIRKLEAERKAEELRVQEKERQLAEAFRKMLEEEAAKAAAEKAEMERIAAEKRRREAEEVAAAFRAEPAGVSAPDPTALKGLKLYLPFEPAENHLEVLPGSDKVNIPLLAEVGAGVRGKALYVSGKTKGIPLPATRFTVQMTSSDYTATGWVRTRGPAVDLVKFSAGPAWGEPLALGVAADGRAWGRVSTVPGHAFQRHPAETVAGRLSGSLPRDEKWHHLALVRHTADGRPGATLYVDAEPVASYVFPVEKENRLPPSVTFAAALGLDRPKDPESDLPLAAVDELCVFDRTLSEGEIRFLAGKALTPDEQPADPVRLVPHTTVTPNAGVVFDAQRKVLWAVSTFGWFWSKDDLGPRPDLQKKQAISCLVRYTYPDFAFDGAWLMPGGGKAPFLSANSPVLDAKNNRLYALTLRAGSVINDLQAEEHLGLIASIDLDKLPKYDPKAGPVEAPAAAEEKLGPGRATAWGDMIASPDGKYLFTGLNRTIVHDIGRHPADLSASPEAVPSPQDSDYTGALRVSPDGKTVFALVRGGRARTPSVQAIDVETWKAGELKRLPEQETLNSAERIVFGPDGRLWTTGAEGIVCVDPETGARRAYPVPLSRDFRGRGATRASMDGRFVFVAEASAKRNRLLVIDGRKEPTRFEELAALAESPGVRVGGPFWTSPDGRFVVFRSGLVVRVEAGDEARRPLPDPLPALPTPKDPLTKD